MKLTIAGLAAFAATKTSAHICNQPCGSYCTDASQGYDADDHLMANYDILGFEDLDECKAHPCSQTWADDEETWHSCERDAAQLEGRKYNHIVKMAKSMMTTKYSLRQIFRMLQNYGCHCFPGQTRAAGGHGPAVDAQDSLCKDLARCHRCVGMEHGDVIDVDESKYRFNVVNGDISCARNTEKGWHQSKRDLCECDAEFARKIGQIWSDDDFNDFYWLHPKDMKKIAKNKLDPEPAKFDMDATCGIIGGGKADACCGSYPNRFPYDSNDKSCCNEDTIFNHVVSVCCEGGQVASPGDC